MSLSKDSEITNEALARLPSWLQKSSNLQDLITIFADRYQTLENIAWTLYTERDINSAIGEQLDVIGVIVTLARLSGQSDNDYRIALLGRIPYLSYSGEAEVLINTYLSLFQTPMGNALYVELIETQPSTVKLTVNILTDPGIDVQAQAVMSRIRAAGINLILQKAINRPFKYRSVFDINHPEYGYESESSPGTGGNYSTIISQYT